MSASSSSASSASMAAQTGTISAPSRAAISCTCAKNGLFSKPSSATLAMYSTGLLVNRNNSRSISRSLVSSTRVRNGAPVFRCACTRSSSALRSSASRPPALAAFSARCNALSTVARSASASSVLMVSISSRGLTRPQTWMTSSFSKQRTT